MLVNRKYSSSIMIIDYCIDLRGQIKATPVSLSKTESQPAASLQRSIHVFNTAVFPSIEAPFSLYVVKLLYCYLCIHSFTSREAEPGQTC